MYSRYHNSPSGKIQLPENYSGCAFSERSAERPVPRPLSSTERASERPAPRPLPSGDTHRVEIATPTAPPPPAASAAPLPPPLPTPPLPDPAPPPAQKPLVGAPTLLQGLGFEELLLLGLIVLLASGEQHSDIVLWLVLLLFCG